VSGISEVITNDFAGSDKLNSTADLHGIIESSENSNDYESQNILLGAISYLRATIRFTQVFDWLGVQAADEPRRFDDVPTLLKSVRSSNCDVING
jgi:hypothetical protein